MSKKIIAQGAEALISLENNAISKHRIPKGYRLPQLDVRLRAQRTRKEAKLLQKAALVIPVPKIININEEKKEITLEYIKGKKLADSLDMFKNARSVCKTLGMQIAKLHDSNIIHADLTTSNMILKGKTPYIIDFGLGFESPAPEHKAVDLHVLKEALQARHYQNADRFFKAVLRGYKTSSHAKKVIKQLEKVERRGRYKQAY